MATHITDNKSLPNSNPAQPPPIPPPLGPPEAPTQSRSNESNVRENSPNSFPRWEAINNSVPKDLKKYLHQPPPAFHLNPSLAHMPQQPPLYSHMNNLRSSSSYLSPYQIGASQMPNILPYQSNNQSYNLPWNGSNNYGSYLRRANQLSYDPATHGVISRIAEERTRPTFSSIESILDAFASINHILESTYMAIHGSFKTITSVADHLIFVRNHFAEIALIPRMVQIVAQFCCWLLQLFGIDCGKWINADKSAEANQAWNEAIANQGSEEWKQLLLANQASSDGTISASSPLWPIFMFFSLVIGTPYIIWRLLGAPGGTIPKTNCPEWTTRRGRHFVALALYDFKARNSNELSFSKNQVLFIKPESLQPGNKWLLACVGGQANAINSTPNDNINNAATNIGLIPLNYVKLVMK